MESFSLQYKNGVFTIWNLRTEKEECQFQDKELLAIHMETELALDKVAAKDVINEAEFHGTVEI